VLFLTSITFNLHAKPASDKDNLGDSPYTSKQAIIMVSNCGKDTWVPGPINCSHGYNTRNADISSTAITRNQPGLYFVYQSAARGPECTISFKSNNKKVVIYYQQNFGSTKSGKITLKVLEGGKYVPYKKSFRGKYRDDVPGVGSFCLDSSK
jgi:hypothetical protein